MNTDSSLSNFVWTVKQQEHWQKNKIMTFLSKVLNFHPFVIILLCKKIYYNIITLYMEEFEQPTTYTDSGPIVVIVNGEIYFIYASNVNC